MKISVIIATYNAEDMLPRAVASFREQTWPDKELLIADGASKDRTMDIIRENADVVTWWVSEPDKGFTDAWNRGIEQATGDWVYFMGADDAFVTSTTLAEAAARLADVAEGQQIAYGEVDMVRSDGTTGERIGGHWNPERFRRVCMCIPHQGTFHRRGMFERYGLFDVSDRVTPTYETLLRYLKDHDAAYLPDLVVGRMQFGGMSTQPWNQLRFYRAYMKAQRKHGTFRWNPELAMRLVQGAVKRTVYLLFGPSAVIKTTNAARALVRKGPL